MRTRCENCKKEKDSRLDVVDAIVARYNAAGKNLIPILQAVQEEFHYLPEDAIRKVATSVGLPVAKVYGVATFYAHFSLKPKGKHVVRVCDGTACHVKGSGRILDALRKRLELGAGTDTTPDELFTVETVSCLGACGLAPVMVVDDEVHGLLKPEGAVAVIDEIIKREKGEMEVAV